MIPGLRRPRDERREPDPPQRDRQRQAALSKAPRSSRLPRLSELLGERDELLAGLEDARGASLRADAEARRAEGAYREARAAGVRDGRELRSAAVRERDEATRARDAADEAEARHDAALRAVILAEREAVEEIARLAPGWSRGLRRDRTRAERESRELLGRLREALGELDELDALLAYVTDARSGPGGVDGRRTAYHLGTRAAQLGPVELSLPALSDEEHERRRRPLGGRGALGLGEVAIPTLDEDGEPGAA